MSLEGAEACIHNRLIRLNRRMWIETLPDKEQVKAIASLIRLNRRMWIETANARASSLVVPCLIRLNRRMWIETPRGRRPSRRSCESHPA